MRNIRINKRTRRKRTKRIKRIKRTERIKRTKRIKRIKRLKRTQKKKSHKVIGGGKIDVGLSKESYGVYLYEIIIDLSSVGSPCLTNIEKVITLDDKKIKSEITNDKIESLKEIFSGLWINISCINQKEIKTLYEKVLEPMEESAQEESIGQKRALMIKDFLQKLFTNIADVNENPKCIKKYKDKLCIFLFSLLQYNPLWTKNLVFNYPATDKDNWKQIYTSYFYEKIFRDKYSEVWECFRTFVDNFNG